MNSSEAEADVTAVQQPFTATVANRPPQDRGPVRTRPSAEINVSTSAPEFEYLRHPPRATITFLHPGYADGENVLMIVSTPDHPSGGLHHGLALDMCSIVADNKTGYFSLAADGNAIQLDRNDVLAAGSYFFIVQHPHAHLVDGASDPAKPYKWPVVTNFRDWQFTQLPEWWRLPDDALTQPSPLDGYSQSSYAQTIHARDVFCRVSQHRTGVEIAHLCPESETAWFARNNMYAYKQRYANDPSYVLKDPANLLLLRSDIHKAFDKERRFVFYPKAADRSLTLHTLLLDSDLTPIYHNIKIHQIDDCSREFVFVRFAWAVLPLLTPFLLQQTPRLIATYDGNKRVYLTEDNQKGLQDRAKEAYASRSMSRSVSPQKRQRTNDNGLVGDGEGEIEDSSLEELGKRDLKRLKREEEEGQEMRGRKRRRHSSCSHGSQHHSFSNSLSDILIPIPQPKTPPPNHPDDADVLRQRGLKRQREMNSDIITSQEDRLWRMTEVEGMDSGLLEELAEHGIEVIDDDNDCINDSNEDAL